MFKFRFIAYTIGTVVLFSSFDVQKCADSLNAAYDAKDYDAYVDAFPDKYEDFVKVYGYDHKNGVKTILYDCSYEHIDFLFSSERDSGSLSDSTRPRSAAFRHLAITLSRLAR